MSAGRAITGLIHATKRIYFCHAKSTQRLTSARLLALSSQLSAKSTGDSEVKDVPIKFSTSKASHKTWKVNNSLGSQHEQPWWKAICISLFFISTILWCLLRKETDVDRKLEQSIFEPSDDEKEE